MNTSFTKEAGCDWFIDQYGYIYRYESDATGKHSVTVANWQPTDQGVSRGSAKEAVRLINAANAAPELYAALQWSIRALEVYATAFTGNATPEMNKARAALAKVQA